jgi:hypothetical protein
MKAYLHFGGAACGLPNGPFQTVCVPAKESPAPRSGQTVSGYGARIPAPYLVQWAGRWRRVYVAQWGNAGSAYLGKPGAWICTVDIERGA